MKKLINILFAITIVSLVSCSSSEDNIIPGEIEVSGSIHTSLLSNLTGNDATSLVSFNGESAATFVTEASVNDEISYEVITASSNVEVVILDFFYTSGDRELWEQGIEITVNTQSNPRVATLKVVNGAVGDEVKFGFTFALKTDGVVDLNTTYIVDPKIKVRS